MKRQLKYEIRENWLLHTMLIFVISVYAARVFPDKWAQHPTLFVFSFLLLADFWLMCQAFWRLESRPIDLTYRIHAKAMIVSILATFTVGGVCLIVLNLPIESWVNAALVLIGIVVSVPFACLTLNVGVTSYPFSK